MNDSQNKNERMARLRPGWRKTNRKHNRFKEYMNAIIIDINDIEIDIFKEEGTVVSSIATEVIS